MNPLNHCPAHDPRSLDRESAASAKMLVKDEFEQRVTVKYEDGRIAGYCGFGDTVHLKLTSGKGKDLLSDTLILRERPATARANDQKDGNMYEIVTTE